MFKLLIVDDEQLTRHFLKNTIETLSSKWEVIGMAVEGTEALDILEAVSVDLIITDIKMPVMDGLELCKIVSEKYPHIHLVILSGYSDFNYAKNAIQYNVNDYLLKPIVNKELEQMLEKLAGICEQDELNAHKQNVLLSTSMKYKEEIIEKFLKAVITGSNAQITSLHPLLYKLNISLIEEECTIALLHIREDELIKRNMPLSNLPLLKLFLYNTAKRLFKKTGTKVFFDSNDYTVLYLPICADVNMEHIAKDLHATIHRAFFEETGLTVYCTIGSSQNDLMKIKESYDHACTAMIHHLIFHRDSSPIYTYTLQQYKDETLQLETLMTSLIYGLHNNDAMAIRLTAKELACTLYPVIAPNNMTQWLYLFMEQLQRSLFKDRDCTYLYQKLKNASIQNADSLYTFILTLLDQIQQFFTVEESENDDANVLVTKAKQYIYDHYMEPISLSLLADYLSVSASYLSNLFHESEGISYIKFLTEVRLKHAASLLTNQPDLKLEAITKQVGYISVKHFSHVFKKHYHQSPGEYRKSCKK